MSDGLVGKFKSKGIGGMYSLYAYNENGEEIILRLKKDKDENTEVDDAFLVKTHNSYLFCKAIHELAKRFEIVFKIKYKNEFFILSPTDNLFFVEEQIKKIVDKE